ncbi:MAG TPA: minor capsid protein [Clostridiales bacterium]|nr:minor capsid protein [Clostridiales bacterium]
MKRILLYLLLLIWEIGFLINIPKYQDPTNVVIAILLMLLPIIILILIKVKNTTIPTNNKKQAIKENAQGKFENTDDINYSLLDKESRRRSDYYYSIHQQKLKSVNITNIDCSKIKPRKLSSVELNFLIYLNNRNANNLEVAGYWTHEYNINYKEVIPQFICQGLLEIYDQKDLSSLKVAELKQILSTKNLPRSGKKIELIQRIKENFAPDELLQHLKSDEKYYRLTPKGKEATKDIKPSATKNLELEDKCYKLIMAGEFNEAFKEIAKYESKKPIPRGLGIDWEEELKNGLSELDLINYTDQLNLNQKLPRPLKKYQKQLNACVILGQMLGVSYNKILKLFQRICNVECDKQLIYEAIVMNCNYFFGKRDILSYLEDGVETYKYVATLDIETCERCAELDGKIFKVRDAEFGVNYPPMCKTCRCTTVPYYYEDSDYSDDTRMARDPVTGKPYEVPANMTYKEWYKKYVEK